MIDSWEKMTSSLRENVMSTERKVDRHLTEKMPRYIKEHKLATKKDVADIDESIKTHDRDLDELENWKEEVTGRVEDVTKNIKNLELKAKGKK